MPSAFRLIARGLFLVALISIAAPALAQTDIVGGFQSLRGHEEGWEEEVGDYAGLPLNEAARLRADTFMPSLLTVPEHQCRLHPVDRMENTGTGRIWKDVDPVSQEVIAYHVVIAWMLHHMVIYMDGRPHPPESAPYTAMGFTTGRWEGNQLVATTTHAREGWLRRNGPQRSGKATITHRFSRKGDVLTWTFIIEDPAYFTEPYIRSRQMRYDVDQGAFLAYPCEAVDEIDRPAGVIPHHLPGTNPHLTWYASTYGLPQVAARGGAETMYPEYQLRLREMRTVSDRAPNR